MKRIAILRHAKSTSIDTASEDFERPLTERGFDAARAVGRKLRAQEQRFDLLLASPAMRVRETIEAVGEQFPYACPIRFEPQMYLADEAFLFGLLRALPETVNQPLLVGHNPGLQRLVLDLSAADDEHFRKRVAHKLPTGAFVAIELPARRWGDLELGTGRIGEMLLPSELD